MSNIEENLGFILSSRYGKDVRQAIHDAIHDCYEDGKAGAVDLTAREQIADTDEKLSAQIANLVANAPSGSEKDSELVDIRVGYNGTAYESAGEAVRGQVGKLSEEIDNIGIRMIPVVKYGNWFDHTRKLTEGYYLSYLTGKPIVNVNYGYSEHYPIKSGTKYFANGFGHGAQFCFYDLSGKFKNGVLLDTGVGVFETPIDCASIRYSVDLRLLDTPITVTEGETVGEYTPYVFLGYRTIKKKILEVGRFCEYKTVTDAVNMAKDGDIVFIYSGVYDNEIVDATQKTISIIGEDIYRVIIKNHFGTYTKAPIQMGSGLLKNVTCIAADNGTPSSDPDGLRPYALHCDYDILANRSLNVENCKLISELNSGVGFGTRKNGKMRFYNCFIESTAQRVALFGHDSAKAALAGEQSLEINNCVIANYNYNYAIRFDSERIPDAKTRLKLTNNVVIDSNNSPIGAYNNNNLGGATEIYNFNNMIGFINDKTSIGNNIESWNYSE